MSLEALQAQAGHASIDSTRIYLHLANDWLVGEYLRAAEAIEAQIDPTADRGRGGIVARLARDPEVEALIDAYRADLIAAGHFAENEVTSPARAFLLRIGGPAGWSRLSLEQQRARLGRARERAGDVDDRRWPRAAKTGVPGLRLSAAREGRGVGAPRVPPAVHAGRRRARVLAEGGGVAVVGGREGRRGRRRAAGQSSPARSSMRRAAS